MRTTPEKLIGEVLAEMTIDLGQESRDRIIEGVVRKIREIDLFQKYSVDGDVAILEIPDDELEAVRSHICALYGEVYRELVTNNVH